MPRLGKILGEVGRTGWRRLALAQLAALVLATAGLSGMAQGSATLLLEEPYGKLGFFTATGHAAVYLSGVCAETPVKLRACRPGETGVVISRYDGVAGYDWVAIPLIPYLYAVEKREDIPLFVDAKTVGFLRDQYRRKRLEGIAPDAANGDMPGGNWVQLVGSAYDRTAYAFQIETTAAKDAAFIRAYNASPNHSHFHTVSNNCADFAKDVINFYYPRALHRSVVADVGITTPKQMAKTMIKYSARHPRLEFTRFVIPQIPGSMARSSKVHGVVESFLKSKKYIVPSAVVSPIFAGCVVAVYEGTGAGRFDPAKQALVYNAERDLEPPIGPEDRRSFQLELTHLVAAESGESGEAKVEKWGRLFRNAAPDVDDAGHPVLRFRDGDDEVSVGIAASNLFAGDAGPAVTKEFLETRVRAELRRGGAPKVSESDVEHDWRRLQKAMNVPESEMAEEQSRRPMTGGAQAVYVGNRQ